MGCPGVAWETATQAKGDTVGWIADNTSITPANQGGNWWFAYGWAPGTGGSSLPALGTTYAAIFSTEAQMPWDWSGKLVNDSWVTQALPCNYGGCMGGYQNFQLSLVDKTKPLNSGNSSFYFIINTYDSRGAAYGNPADEIANCANAGAQVIANFGQNGSYSTLYGTSSTFQSAAWNTWKTFTWSITPAQVQQLAADINAKCGSSLSTRAADYGINNIFWGTEINVWGTGTGGACPCPFGYRQGGATRQSKLMVQ
jgi:hypothetical protein